MSTANKETVYIDVDDEITGIIDKVNGSNEKIVALVLPKRASVLQSIINMKLLKRTADDSKKRVVLITSEAGLLPLAGAVGLHVAKTLQSRPMVPLAPKMPSNTVSINEDESEILEDTLDPNASVGELAGIPDDEEAIEVDDEEAEEDVPIVVGASDKVIKKSAKNKKFKIPNFDKFRLRLFLGILALFIVVFGWYAAYNIMPKAKITLKTDTTSVAVDATFTAKPDAKALDEIGLIVPATVKELKKADTQKTPATGQKDVGTKASGTMTITNCINDGAAHTLPSGTGFSSGEHTFLTTEAVTLNASVYSGSNCRTDLASTLGFRKDVPVVASEAGDKHNLSTRSYTTAISGITGSGSSMSGGTTKLVKVVNQQDIDSVKQKVIDASTQKVKQELADDLTDDKYTAILDTYTAAPPVVTSSPVVGEEATEVGVTVNITHTMLGVKSDDLKTLTENIAKKKIDTSKQVILDNGLDKGTFKIVEKKPTNETKLNFQSSVLAGPQLDGETIKKEIAGKKKGDALRLLQGRPGIKDVQIEYSPFWVYSTPKKASKITVIFEQTSSNAGDTK